MSWKILEWPLTFVKCGAFFWKSGVIWIKDQAIRLEEARPETVLDYGPIFQILCYGRLSVHTFHSYWFGWTWSEKWKQSCQQLLLLLERRKAHRYASLIQTSRLLLKSCQLKITKFFVLMLWLYNLLLIFFSILFSIPNTGRHGQQQQQTITSTEHHKYPTFTFGGEMFQQEENNVLCSR